MIDLEIEDLCSCVQCGSVCQVGAVVKGGWQQLWDPGLQQRRAIIAAIGVARWKEWFDRGQRWGAGFFEDHVCYQTGLRSYDLAALGKACAERQQP